ncbi:MAG: hypothetical protein WC575_04110 [Patescibacteria group bacterium]
MTEIKEQIKYLRKRFTELVGLCEKDNTLEVSNDVRNVAQDIILRLNRLLDNILFEYFTKIVRPNLSDKEVLLYEKGVQFPVCSKIDDIKSVLGGFGARDLEDKNPEIFAIIEQVQPYHTGNEWICHLRNYSNFGHRKLIPQHKKRDISLILGDVVKISDSASVTMNNCSVNGVPIQHLTVDKGVVRGDLDPRLNPRVEVEVSYLLEGENIDVLWLCQKSILGIEKISESFEKVFAKVF